MKNIFYICLTLVFVFSSVTFVSCGSDDEKINPENAGSDSGQDFKPQKIADRDEAGNIKITAKNFPDPVFRGYLYDKYGTDGVLNDAEIDNVTQLDLRRKGIKSLEGIEFFPLLEKLDCAYNYQLTSLDVSRNTKLSTLYCEGIQFLGEAFNALVSSLPTVNNGTMHVTIGAMTKNQVRAARAKGWIPMFDSSPYASWTPCAWEDGIDIVGTNFPDVYFRSYLLNTTYGVDGVLTDKEIEELTEMNVSSKSIQSLQGIEFFTALKKLHCSSNQLTSLDVSKNTALTYLYCHNNRLTSLDVTNNTAMIYINCYGNQLTSLDVSKNTAMTALDCYDNRLTSLDVSKNTAIGWLECRNNQLTSLDVSKNTKLLHLDCRSNQLTSLDVSKNTKLEELYYDTDKVTVIGWPK